MFVSHTYKLLFYEVPRTGSRSVSKTLAELDPGAPTAFVRKKRSDSFDYHRYDRERVLKHPDYCFFAAHRNPYDRIRSHYKYRKRWGNPDSLKSLSFDEYLAWACDGTFDERVLMASQDAPICELLDTHLVNYWLRFDHLEDDWITLGNNLGVNLPKLARINSSGSSLDSESLWTEARAEKLFKRFEADFDYFGYSADSWQRE
jgi:hypothetical protein